MLRSSELLKKKICVTVFLDELFEELEEEAQEDPTQESREVNSGVKISEEPPNAQVNMFICENGNSNERGGNNLENSRPRKRRQQSKFGKSNNNLRRELSCCGRGQIKEGESQKLDAKPKPSKPIPSVRSPVSKLVTNANKSIMTEASFLLKSKVNIQKIDRKVDCTTKALFSSKSSQIDSPYLNTKKCNVLLEDKEQQTDEKYLINTQHCSKNMQRSIDNRRDEVKHCRPKLVEECWTSQLLENITKEDALFVASSSEQISNVTPEEVIRVWSTCKKVWNENVESDVEVSEVECNTDGNKAAKHYCAVLDSNRNSIIELEKTKTYTSQFLSTAGSDTKFLKSSRKVVESKQETKSAILEMSRVEETHTLEQTKFRVLMEPHSNQFECRSKNFAEGDIFEEVGSNYFFQFGSKENLPRCDKVLSEEANEMVISTAKIQFINSKTLHAISQHFAEVFMKQENGSFDTESEMIFAENPYDAEESQDIQAFELEGSISKTEFLKRINRTVEIFEDGSINNPEDISNELIIICQNVQKENICVDSWKGSTKSLSEMKELYLKDSKENTMYLIEIPFMKITREAVP